MYEVLLDFYAIITNFYHDIFNALNDLWLDLYGSSILSSQLTIYDKSYYLYDFLIQLLTLITIYILYKLVFKIFKWFIRLIYNIGKVK